MNQNPKDKMMLNAWNLMQEDSSMKKIFFFPGTISIIFLTIMLVYQTIYTYVVLLNKNEEVLVMMLDFFHSNYMVEMATWLVIFMVMYMLTMPMFECWLIYYLDKKNSWEEMTWSELIWWWMYSFLPYFEYTNLFSQLKFMSLMNAYLFCLSFARLSFMWILNVMFWFLLVLSVMLNILFAYSKYEMVLNNKSALASVSQSMKMALFNLWTTTKLYFFLFIVNISVMMNFFVFLLFPMMMVAAITYMTSKFFLAITVWILSMMFVFLMMFLWYLGWVFEVFKTSVWYYAYLYWKESMKNMETEEDDDDNNDE